MRFVMEMDSFFFFSSRRRHTRWNCDWSSDVCSSDLVALVASSCMTRPSDCIADGPRKTSGPCTLNFLESRRSEERRVGKECRYRWSPYQQKKKKVQDCIRRGESRQKWIVYPLAD